MKEEFANLLRKMADRLDGKSHDYYYDPNDRKQDRTDTYHHKEGIQNKPDFYELNHRNQEEEVIKKIKFQLSIPLSEGEQTNVTKFIDELIERKSYEGKISILNQMRNTYIELLYLLKSNLESKNRVRCEHTINSILTYLENDQS